MQQLYWVVTYELFESTLNAHLFDPSGEVLETVVSFDQEYTGINSSFQSVFSPDGTKFAFTVQEEGLRLYDFDRETGRFTNTRIIGLPDSARHVRGVQFSPDSRFIYCTNAINLYQVEVATEEVVLIAHYPDGRDETGWPIAMGEMRTGPDCRIYVSPSSSTWYLHVIHRPNEKGLACNLELEAVRTPTHIEFSLPNVPLRPNTAPCLDIPWILTPPVSTNEEERGSTTVSVLPNPAWNEVRLFGRAALSGQKLRWSLFDAYGKQVGMWKLDGAATALSLDRSVLGAGLYLWRLSDGGRWLGSGRLVLR